MRQIPSISIGAGRMSVPACTDSSAISWWCSMWRRCSISINSAWPSDRLKAHAAEEERMKHCLVVDDSAVIRKVARRILEELSFSSAEAENGRDALDQCLKSMPYAVLLDWNMPVIDGIFFLVALRKERVCNFFFIVLGTTENDV